MTIPQCSPQRSYLAHRAEIDAAVARVLASGRYILGSEVEAFEREFAAYLGGGECVGVASGTDALHLALRAAGIGPGDVVITAANSAVATAAAIEMAGATIAFADVDDETLTLDPRSVESLLPARAVIPVHLFGRPAAIPEGLLAIEDCAQAHGAPVGTRGTLAAFSFYPTKNLAALGDGGAVFTRDTDLAARLRALRQYGWSHERDRSFEPGFNSRLDELQAAILRAKLPFLDRENARRREIARQYDAALSGVVRTPAADAGHVYHQYVIRTPQRDRLHQSLRDAGIATLIHYPVPIHEQPAYRGRVILPDGGLPVTERAAREILSLPMFPELTDDEVQRVIDAVREGLLPARGEKVPRSGG